MPILSINNFFSGLTHAAGAIQAPPILMKWYNRPRSDCCSQGRPGNKGGHISAPKRYPFPGDFQARFVNPGLPEIFPQEVVSTLEENNSLIASF